MIQFNKICSKCEWLKVLEDFYLYKNRKEVLLRRSICKICDNNSNAKWRNKNKDKRKEYSKKYEKNRIRSADQVAKIKKQRSDNLNLKTYQQKYGKQYYQKNKSIIFLKEKQRTKKNILYRIAKKLRKRLYISIKNNYKSGSAVRDLGCSVGELRQWLEQQFQPEMTWENYGINGWHIDHIIPLSKLDLTNRKDLVKACHWFNLRPMWEKENISRGNRI